MPIRGHIENGNVVLDEALQLPNGTPVNIEAIPRNANGGPDPFWGLFSEDAELLDQIVKDSMKNRSERQIRVDHA